MFITANDVDVPATSLNNELNVPLIVLQGHLGKIEEDTWDMANRTPYSAMKYRMNEGLGGTRAAENRALVEIDAITKPRVLHDLFRKGMAIQAGLIKRKQEGMAARLGINSLGMGHIMGAMEAVASSEGPWYNPGANHNEKHRDGSWVDLSKFSLKDIEDVKRVQKLSQYEVEHMSSVMFGRLLAKTRQGQSVAGPDAKPLAPPIDAAKEALDESVGGKVLLVGSEVVSQAKAAIGTVYDSVASVGGFAGDLVKWLPWIAGGAAAIFIAPHLIKTVKAARA